MSKPSADALELNESLKLLRACLGSPIEEFARREHAKVVEAVKQRQPLPPWCCASGCQGCTEFQEHSKEQT